MKTKISHLGRSSVSVILAVMMLLSTMLIGTVSTVNASSINKGYIYFKVPDTWTTKSYVYLGLKQDNGYIDLTKMSPITNSGLYYVQAPDHSSWKDEDVLFLATSNSWISGNLDLSKTAHYTKSIKQSTESGKYYYFTSSDNLSTEASISCSSDTSASTIKCDQTVNVKMMASDGSYVDNTNAGNKVELNAYYLSSNDIVTQTTIDNITSSSKYEGAVKTTSVTLKVAKTAAEYSFDGWYASDGNLLSKELEYSYVVSDSANVEARFKKLTAPVAESVTLTASPETVTSGGSTTLTATLTNKAAGVGNVTYTFKNADGTVVGTVKDSAENAASVDVANITSDTTYTVTVSAAEHSDVTATATVTVKQLENWYIYGNKYAGGWATDGNNKGNTAEANKLTYDAENNCYYIDSTYTDSYFRFHNTTQEYGPNSKNEDEELKITDLEKHTLSTNTDQAFKYVDTSCNNYRICLDPTNKKVWVEENVKKYNISNTSGKELTISPNQASADDEVTVTATSIPQGQILDTVTVVGADGKSVDTTVIGNTATFVMPEQNVKVTNVTFRDAETYTVNFSSSNNNFGTVSAEYNSADFTSGAKVTEGGTVTFTAEPKSGYALSGWTVNGVPASSTTNPYTITVNSTTTVVANFQEVTVTPSDYYLLCGEDATFQADSYTSVPLYKNGKNAYYADFNAAGVPKGKDYYIIFSTKKDTSGIIVTNDTNNIKINEVDNDKGFSLGNRNENVNVVEQGTNNVRFAKVYIKSDSDVSGFTIKITGLDLDSKKITYSAEPKFKEAPKNAVNIFAKNGTIATNGTQDYGVTKVTSGVIDPTGSEKAGYTKYMAVKGSIITVQTTVKETYKNAGYYVYAYCVNGKTVPAQKTEPGVYSASYTIDGTNTDIEITPVYFNTNIEKAGDYITFYVNADELKGKWGDTVALYTYYYKSDVVDNNNAFNASAYPGQPMLQNKDGLFYIKVPKYYYDKGVKQFGYGGYDNKPYSVSGMTINNYGLESLHSTLKGAKDADGNVANRQSYDYKDFAVLAEQGYDTIMFDVKYRKGTSNQSSLLNNEKDAPVMTDPKIDILTYGEKTHNGWDDFINYFSGNKTDVLGYDLDPKQAKKLYVVSTGNQKTTVGVWSTEWYVFDQDGKFIVQGNPNDFILTDKDVAEDSTNEIWNALKHYKGAETKICYESEMNAKTSHEDGNDGIRVDGRWYYTKADDVKVTLNASVQYSKDHGTTFINDTNTNTESNTGFVGQVTGVKAAINDATSYEFPLNATNAVLTASSSSLWLFKGWYVKDEKGNYIEYDKDAMSEIELVTGAYTEFVARYIEIGSGQLVLSHTAYDGPDKLGGRGTYYIQVDLTDKDGKTTTYDYTTGSITIPIAQSDESISIKLKTVCAGNNTFYRFYKQDKDGKYQPFVDDDGELVGKTGPVEYSFTVNPSDLFDLSGQQVTKALNYYSDISPVTGDAVLNYRYKNRFDQDRVYTVKVKLDDTYYDYTKQAYIIDPTKEKHKKLIMDNAPAIDDLHKDCLWSIAKQSPTINGTNVVLDGIQTGKTFNVELSYYSDDVQTDDAQTDTDFVLKYSGKLALNSYIKNSKTDDFYKTAAEVNGKKFLYWSVVSKDTNREIARCYSQYFNLRVTDNFIVTPVYDEKKDSFISIGNATYTREQYTEAGINYDYLYADFIVAFMSPDAELLNQSSKYKTGVIVELNQNAKVTETDVIGGTFGAVGSTVNYSGIKFNSSSVEIQKLATGKSSSVKYKNAENVSNIAYKFEINNSGYNNKNRLDYYVKFKNTQAYRNYVMKAYYYVYEVDANGNAVAGTFKITNEVYFNLYDIGNSETKK